MDDFDRDKLRKELNLAFKASAFMPRRDALDFCVDQLESCDKPKRAKIMEKMIATLRQQQLTTSVLTKDVLRDVITQILNAASQSNTPLFNIFDAFSIKKFILDRDSRKMLQSNCPLQVTAGVEKANESFRHRFQMVTQRAKRCKHLDKIRTRIHTVDSLVGLSKKMENVVIIGMLVQQKDDCYHLEDLAGAIQVEFTDTEFRPGLYVEGGVYMFEGTFDNNVFLVTNAALVPLESAIDTRDYFGQENWFGGEDLVAFRNNDKLTKAVISNPDASIVILSDIFLDDSTVLKAVYHMLSGFSAAPPVAFIFCGNFCSQPRQAETMHLLEDGFRRLGNMLSEPDYKECYKNTQFIFVPGPDDPPFTIFLPRPHLPATLFKFMENVPNVSFTTNPVRIQYGSKEIVVLRDDLVEKMCKHAVNHVQQQDIPKYFSRTVLSQAHLSPFCMHVSPVLWDWDFALALHPLPDLVVIADKFGKFSETQAGTLVANPGSFSKSSFGFHVYYPSHDRVDDSQLPSLD